MPVFKVQDVIQAGDQYEDLRHVTVKETPATGTLVTNLTACN